MHKRQKIGKHQTHTRTHTHRYIQYIYIQYIYSEIYIICDESHIFDLLKNVHIVFFMMNKTCPELCNNLVSVVEEIELAGCNAAPCVCNQSRLRIQDHYK